MATLYTQYTYNHFQMFHQPVHVQIVSVLTVCCNISKLFYWIGDAKAQTQAQITASTLEIFFLCSTYYVIIPHSIKLFHFAHVRHVLEKPPGLLGYTPLRYQIRNSSTMLQLIGPGRFSVSFLCSDSICITLASKFIENFAVLRQRWLSKLKQSSRQ